MVHWYHVLLPMVLAVTLRPSAPLDTRFVGGSMEEALSVLADGAATSHSLDGRAFDEDYRHWQVADGGARAALAATGMTAAAEQSPVVAGLVGIAAATGLRDLAAVSLYLLSDHAEDEGDWDLCDMCLRAIPFVDPHFVDAYLIRAFLLAKTNPEEAERILRRGATWNPGDWEIWHDLAWLYLRPIDQRVPDPRRALTYLEAAVRVKHPMSVGRLYAYVLAHVGRRAEASAVFRGMLDRTALDDRDRSLALRGLDEIARGRDRLAERMAARVRYTGGKGWGADE